MCIFFLQKLVHLLHHKAALFSINSHHQKAVLTGKLNIQQVAAPTGYQPLYLKVVPQGNHSLHQKVVPQGNHSLHKISPAGNHSLHHKVVLTGKHVFHQNAVPQGYLSAFQTCLILVYHLPSPIFWLSSPTFCTYYMQWCFVQFQSFIKINNFLSKKMITHLSCLLVNLDK